MEFIENSPEDLSSYFENTPDLVCIAKKSGYFKSINKAVVDKLGYSKEELLSRPINSFIYPEDLDITKRTRWEMFEGKPLVNFENRYITKAGKIIWLHWTSFYLPKSECVFAIAKDITDKKEIEKNIEDKYREYKKLAHHFKGNIETDRQKFAEELHEELAQIAAVIKLNLSSVTNSLPHLPVAVRERIELASGLSELLIKTIRKISFDVSPYMLEYEFLNDALATLCTDFASLHSIPCLLETDYEEESLSNEIKIDFFRICQEALKNVINHAQAESVNINILQNEEKVFLTIFDNGKGFDVNKERQRSGLSTISDRVASINGKLKISSKPGEGTMIRVEVDRQPVISYKL